MTKTGGGRAKAAKAYATPAKPDTLQKNLEKGGRDPHSKAAIAAIKAAPAVSSEGVKVLTPEQVAILKADGLSAESIEEAQTSLQKMEAGSDSSLSDIERLKEIHRMAGDIDDRKAAASDAEAAEKALQAQKRRLAKLAAQGKKNFSGPGKRKYREKLADHGVLNQTDQAYLLQNIQKLNVEENAPTAADLPRLVLVNTKENLLNKLMLSESRIALMGASSTDISGLVPYIRIFKKDIFFGQTRIREFKFSAHSPDLQEYFRSGAMSGKEVGLKSFNFETTGKDFMSAGKVLRGTVVMFFKSLGDMNRDGTQDDSASWDEMLHLAGPSIEDAVLGISADVLSGIKGFQASEGEEPDGVRNRAEIYAQIGWNYSNEAIKDQDLRDAIDQAIVTLSLEPDGNTNFTFNEDGSVELAINFVASSTAAANPVTANILSIESTPGDMKTLRELEKQLASLHQIASDESTALIDTTILSTLGVDPVLPTEDIKKKIKTKQEEIDEILEGHKLSSYQGFMNYIYKKKRFWSFNVSDELYRYGIYDSKMKSATKPVLVTEEAKNEILGTFEKNPSGNLEEKEAEIHQRTIAYFYLGDLLNYMAQSLVPISYRAEGKNMGAAAPQTREILIGNYVFHIFPTLPPDQKIAAKEYAAEYADKVTTATYNLAKLPISMAMFNKFMYNIIMKRQVSVMNFDQFIKKAVPMMIDNALNSFVTSRRFKSITRDFTAQRSAISISHVSGEVGMEGFAAARGSAEIQLDNEETRKILDLYIRSPRIDAKGVTDIFDRYLIQDFTIIHGTRIPAEAGIGIDQIEDAKKGVYHLGVGDTRGIVTGIEFSQQSGLLKDINIYESISNNNRDLSQSIVKMPYDATVKMIGPPTFQPGQIVFINPSIAGIGDVNSRRALARNLGLGGVYQIIDVSCTSSPGALITTLNCKFTSYSPVERSGEEVVQGLDHRVGSFFDNVSGNPEQPPDFNGPGANQKGPSEHSNVEGGGSGFFGKGNSGIGLA